MIIGTSNVKLYSQRLSFVAIELEEDNPYRFFVELQQHVVLHNEVLLVPKSEFLVFFQKITFFVHRHF